MTRMKKAFVVLAVAAAALCGASATAFADASATPRPMDEHVSGSPMDAPVDSAAAGQ